MITHPNTTTNYYNSESVSPTVHYCLLIDLKDIFVTEEAILSEERTTEDDRKLIMEARQKAAEKMKKLSRTKTDSVESNSMEDGGEGKQASKPSVHYT